MRGKMQETKGRLKRAAGEVSGSQRLKDEGDVDKFSGKAKQVKEKVEKKLRDLDREN